MSSSLWAQRIVSLSPKLTRQLCVLDMNDHIVGVTTYCVRPESMVHKEKIGSLQHLHIEKILALQPDIVVAGALNPHQ